MPTEAYLKETVRLPAFSEMEVMTTTQTSGVLGDWILEGELREKILVMVARAIVQSTDGKMPVCLLNPGAEPATVYIRGHISVVWRWWNLPV